MAGLISTGIWGFICSMLPTGERDEKGRPIMEEHFNTGFAGWGWKIWKTVAGFFRLEIDELVVRRTMTVFELLIQKIRAVKGAYAITQANGKIKTVELSTDGTAYLITLEESDMSFVEHDLIRCQEFMNTQKFYHVEIESITAGVIRIPTSEFDTSTANIPMPGDEIVQFGNSSHDQQYAGRHSAIYMHADESGQPAIDVMFDIYSKDWDGCVKTRVGGEIPGSNGSRGFYCENGMIKGVNNTGHPVYCIYPDGSAMFGDGSAQFNTDKSGHIADGAIAWQWNEEKNKYVCTMKGVVLTWENLDDEAKENLKGDKGDAGLDGNNGAEGVPGRPGVDGKTTYTWIRYADNANGAGISNNPTGKLYIGFAYNKESATESSIPSDYTWSLIKGSDGRNGTDGVPGAPGADGKTTYTWIAYSDSPDGSDMYQVPTDNTKYIGIAVNKDAKIEGTNPVDYTWSLFKGRDGVDGKPGEDGKPGVDANLLPWIANWSEYATELGEEYIVTPKMFSGTKSADGKLTGIAQGKDCITIDGVKHTGIFALVDNRLVFELDPITKKYKFTGEIDAIGKFSTSVEGARIEVDPDKKGLIMYNAKGHVTGKLGFISYPDSNITDSAKIELYELNTDGGIRVESFYSPGNITMYRYGTPRDPNSTATNTPVNSLRVSPFGIDFDINGTAGNYISNDTVGISRSFEIDAVWNDGWHKARLSFTNGLLTGFEYTS